LRGWRRIDGVDLLRGVAILTVLMNHVNMQLIFADVPYTQGLPEQLVHTLVWSGQYGVQIYFVVSGFLIASTTLRRWGSVAPVDPKGFYQLRFARIAPLLLLLLAVLSGLDLARVEHFIVGDKAGGLGRALLAALTFHINWLEASRAYLPGNWDILWSLSVEEMFYLFFPLACRLFRRRSYLAVPLTIFVLLGPFARMRAFNPNPVWREYSYLGGMDAISLGCLIALVLDRGLIDRRAIRALALLGAAMVVFILCFSLTAERLGLVRHGLDMTVLAAGTSMLVASAASTRWMAPKLMTPLLAMGRLSYEIYLTHMFVVIAFFGVFAGQGKSLRFVPVLFAMVILGAAVLGWAVARSYSEPMNRWLRRKWDDGPAKLGTVIE